MVAGVRAGWGRGCALWDTQGRASGRPDVEAENGLGCSRGMSPRRSASGTKGLHAARVLGPRRALEEALLAPRARRGGKGRPRAMVRSEDWQRGCRADSGRAHDATTRMPALPVSPIARSTLLFKALLDEGGGFE